MRLQIGIEYPGGHLFFVCMASSTTVPMIAIGWHLYKCVGKVLPHSESGSRAAGVQLLSQSTCYSVQSISPFLRHRVYGHSAS